MTLLKHKKGFILKLSITAAAIILVLAGFMRKIDSGVEYIYSIAGGGQQPDSNIVIIHISADDIESIGPWPVKRSYYALLIRSLNDLNVKSIGLEVFLSAKFVTQAVYDNLLTKEIERSDNIVLSSVAGSIKTSENNYYVDSLSYPTPKLINPNLATGHLNYIKNQRIFIPFKLNKEKISEKAFSLRLLNKVEENKNGLYINFISSWKSFRQFSLLEFFEAYENDKASLAWLKDKIIIIGISDPQIAYLNETNYDKEMPGAALHAFALDNLIRNRGININYYYFLIIFFFAISVLLELLLLKYPLRRWIFSAAAVILFFIFSFILYRFFYLDIPYTAFLLPFLLVSGIELVMRFLEKEKRIKEYVNEAEVYRSLLHKKEFELGRLQRELDLSKESDTQQLLDKIKDIKLDISRLKETDEDRKETVPESTEIQNFYGLVYRSKVINSIIDLIKKAAPEDAAILILGESGTGKELLARAVHNLSKRCNGNFIPVNCGALTDTLLESELFGHVKGAFTGAVSDRVGRFEAADKGTIFLDEVAETTENFQIKLLRVLQSGDYEKVGSSKTFHSDVRIIAATNRNLEAALREKKFREDLYYRLNVIKIELPPLRDRREDIEPLVHYFLDREGDGFKISLAAMKALNDYEWKGNIRELEAVIKRAVIFARSEGRDIIQLADLTEDIVKVSKYRFEELVLDSLRQKGFTHSSIVDTAKELNVNRTLISENFRGLVFKTYVENSFNLEDTTRSISGSSDNDVNERVIAKVKTFIQNIEADSKGSSLDFTALKERFSPKYKNLPKKFHFYLDETIKHSLRK